MMNPVRFQSAQRSPVISSATDDLFGRFGRIFDDFASGQTSGQSGVDFYETEEGFVLELAVPGLSAADINVDVEGRQLTIKAEQEDAAEEGRRYWLRGLSRGSFTRTVRLPRSVDTEAVTATVQAGLLVVTMPRSAEARPRKVVISEN